MGKRDSLTEGEVEADVAEKVIEPPLYKVWLVNDDYTAMEFVVEILMSVFRKSPEEAVDIMLRVHKEGVGLCGVFTFDVAETKVETVHVLAREKGFPLKCTMERE